MMECVSIKEFFFCRFRVSKLQSKTTKEEEIKMTETHFEIAVCKSMKISPYEVTLPAEVARILCPNGSEIEMTVIVEPIYSYPLKFMRQTHPSGGWRSNKKQWKAITKDHPFIVGETLRFTQKLVASCEFIYDLKTEFIERVNRHGIYFGKCISEGSADRAAEIIGTTGAVLCVRRDEQRSVFMGRFPVEKFKPTPKKARQDSSGAGSSSKAAGSSGKNKVVIVD
ncbi:hypothetical protein ACHQM5_020320 [Ranunculus cassubicifolius]